MSDDKEPPTIGAHHTTGVGGPVQTLSERIMPPAAPRRDYFNAPHSLIIQAWRCGMDLCWELQYSQLLRAECVVSNILGSCQGTLHPNDQPWRNARHSLIKSF